MEIFLLEMNVRNFEELVKSLFGSQRKIEQFCPIT